MKSGSGKRAPNIVNLTVKRRYLTEREVERLMDCARKYGRYGHRDATMIHRFSSATRIARSSSISLRSSSRRAASGGSCFGIGLSSNRARLLYVRENTAASGVVAATSGRTVTSG